MNRYSKEFVIGQIKLAARIIEENLAWEMQREYIDEWVPYSPDALQALTSALDRRVSIRLAGHAVS